MARKKFNYARERLEALTRPDPTVMPRAIAPAIEAREVQEALTEEGVAYDQGR